jgi:hypothetical protein
MRAARLKVSLDLLAQTLFQGAATIRLATMDADDHNNATVTLLIEGEELPPAPPKGQLYPLVAATYTEHRDESNLVPAKRFTVKFEPV